MDTIPSGSSAHNGNSKESCSIIATSSTVNEDQKQKHCHNAFNNLTVHLTGAMQAVKTIETEYSRQSSNKADVEVKGANQQDRYRVEDFQHMENLQKKIYTYLDMVAIVSLFFRIYREVELKKRNEESAKTNWKVSKYLLFVVFEVLLVAVLIVFIRLPAIHVEFKILDNQQFVQDENCVNVLSEKGVASFKRSVNVSSDNSVNVSSKNGAIISSENGVNVPSEKSVNETETKQDIISGINETIICEQSKLWDGCGLKILVVGRLHTGKSTLIKGLLEKNGHITPVSIDDRQTKPTINEEDLVVNGVAISIMSWNSPDRKDIEAFKGKQIQEFDLILYILKMSETRFPPKDSYTMKMMIDLFGPRIINKTIFVLTHANMVGSVNMLGEYIMSEYILHSETTQWKTIILETLNETSTTLVVLPEQFVHAGHPSKPELYSIHWPSKVLEAIYNRLSDKKRPALTRACEKYWRNALQGNYNPGTCSSF